MTELLSFKSQLTRDGFCIIPSLLNQSQVRHITQIIDDYYRANPRQDSHAIRRVLIRIPNLAPSIANDAMEQLIRVFGDQHFLTKSIYFDKPGYSNWFVPFHQDLSISVDKKGDHPDYSNWTKKEGIIGVHPPEKVLQNTFTLRLHLDDADEKNGALKVLPRSHARGVVRRELISVEEPVICRVRAGDVMVMSPLLFHASQKSVSPKRRRVLHLEFCNMDLEESFSWLEKMAWPAHNSA